MTEIHSYYRDEAYDPLLAHAYEFAARLGMRRIAPLDNISVIKPEYRAETHAAMNPAMPGEAEEYGAVYTGLPQDEIFLLDEADPYNMRDVRTIYLLGGAVHEIVHSSMGGRIATAHGFVREAHAGAGEYLYLQHLEARDVRQPLPARLVAHVRQNIDMPDMEAAYCYETENGAISSSGLISFLAIHKLLSRCGLSARDLLQQADPYSTITAVIADYDPLLLEVIQQSEETPERVRDLARMCLQATQLLPKPKD